MKSLTVVRLFCSAAALLAALQLSASSSSSSSSHQSILPLQFASATTITWPTMTLLPECHPDDGSDGDVVLYPPTFGSPGYRWDKCSCYIPSTFGRKYTVEAFPSQTAPSQFGNYGFSLSNGDVWGMGTMVIRGIPASVVSEGLEREALQPVDTKPIIINVENTVFFRTAGFVIEGQLSPNSVVTFTNNTMWGFGLFEFPYDEYQGQTTCVVFLMNYPTYAPIYEGINVTIAKNTVKDFRCSLVPTNESNDPYQPPVLLSEFNNVFAIGAHLGDFAYSVPPENGRMLHARKGVSLNFIENIVATACGYADSHCTAGVFATEIVMLEPRSAINIIGNILGKEDDSPIFARLNQYMFTPMTSTTTTVASGGISTAVPFDPLSGEAPPTTAPTVEVPTCDFWDCYESNLPCGAMIKIQGNTIGTERVGIAATRGIGVMLNSYMFSGWTSIGDVEEDGDSYLANPPSDGGHLIIDDNVFGEIAQFMNLTFPLSFSQGSAEERVFESATAFPFHVKVSNNVIEAMTVVSTISYFKPQIATSKFVFSGQMYYTRGFTDARFAGSNMMFAFLNCGIFESTRFHIHDNNIGVTIDTLVGLGTHIPARDGGITRLNATAESLTFPWKSPPVFCNNFLPNHAAVDTTAASMQRYFASYQTTMNGDAGHSERLIGQFFAWRCGCNPAPADPATAAPSDWCTTQGTCASFTYAGGVNDTIFNLCPSAIRASMTEKYPQLQA